MNAQEIMAVLEQRPSRKLMNNHGVKVQLSVGLSAILCETAQMLISNLSIR